MDLLVCNKAGRHHTLQFLVRIPTLFINIYRPDNTLIGGTKIPGDGSTDVRPDHHKMIMNYASTYFPWLKVTVCKNCMPMVKTDFETLLTTIT